MESLSDYFQLSSINTVPDFLVLSAVVIFIVGVVSIAFDPIRINRKSSYYFYFAILLFVIAILMGWNDYIYHLKNAWDIHIG